MHLHTDCQVILLNEDVMMMTHALMSN